TVVAIASAMFSGRALLAIFAVAWFAISFAGLIVVYWASHLQLDWYLATSAPRIVLPLIVAGAAIAPLYAGEAWRQSLRELREHAAKADLSGRLSALE